MKRKISRRRSKQRGSLGEVRSRNTLKGFEPLERRQMLAMVVDDFIKIASNTNGGPALQNEDKFGRSVANIGDVDGDGVIDMAVGTTRDDTGGVQRGALYILFMNSDGTVRDHQKIASGVGNGPSLDDGDYFGRSVAAIGDIDGDGVPDVVVGADGDDTGGAGRGVVYVLRLNRDGSVKSRSRIGNSLNGGPTLDDGDEFGRAVAYLGDLNGDGYPELAVAARGDDRGGTDRGAVYVLSLAPDGTVNGTKKLASGLNNVPPLSDNASFGRSLGILGDVDGDGVGDLAVGAYAANVGGAAHILFLNSDGSVKRSERHTGGGSFGSAVSAAGDLDGDGVLDTLVGANRSSPVIDNVLYRYSGAIYTILLNPDGTEKLRGRIDASTGRDRGLGLPLLSGDYFGRSIDSLGDINGDGKPEFAVGARGDSSVGTDRGAVYVLTLTPGAFISGTKFLDVNSNGLRDKSFLFGTTPDVTFVIDVSGSSLDVLSGESVGDVNGDGVSNSVLDVELQCVLELTNALAARGQSENVRVSIIVFSSSAEPVDMDLVSSGDQFWTRPNADIDGNGVPDVEDVVRQIGAGYNNTGTGTDFSDALAAAVELQGVMQTPSGQGNVIFMSDGEHNGSD